VWYQSKRWRDLRLQVLERDDYRCMCAECMGRYLRPVASVVHHLTPHRGDETLFFDLRNLSSRTVACHNAETGRERRYNRWHKA
jgi:5-methylcytosine-specific restriction protein A